MCFFGTAEPFSNVDMSDSESTLEVFSRRFAPWLSSAGCDVSLIDDFVRMRRYRERASEFELLAENEPLSEVRIHYRIIARQQTVTSATNLNGIRAKVLVNPRRLSEPLQRLK